MGGVEESQPWAFSCTGVRLLPGSKRRTRSLPTVNTAHPTGCSPATCFTPRRVQGGDWFVDQTRSWPSSPLCLRLPDGPRLFSPTPCGLVLSEGIPLPAFYGVWIGGVVKSDAGAIFSPQPELQENLTLHFVVYSG